MTPLPQFSKKIHSVTTICIHNIVEDYFHAYSGKNIGKIVDLVLLLAFVFILSFWGHVGGWARSTPNLGYQTGMYVVDDHINYL